MCGGGGRGGGAPRARKAKGSKGGLLKANFQEGWMEEVEQTSKRTGIKMKSAYQRDFVRRRLWRRG